MEESDNKGVMPYLFNAKELDEETGLYFYGARYLDPTGTTWLSVDPLFEKYVGMSPYNYCAGNPLVYRDPDGRIIMIIVGEESFQYNPNSTNNYTGINEVITKSISELNKMNSVHQGNIVLDVLSNSNISYILRSNTSALSNGYIATKGTETDFGGQIELNHFAHELFHHYQRENGQGGPTYFNEIEAYTFEREIILDYMGNNNYDGESFTSYESTRFVVEDLSSECQEYEDAASNIIVNGTFNREKFEKSVQLFKNCSGANGTGLYNQSQYKERKGNERYLLESLYPQE